jgi:hypothetical protein
MKKKYKHILKFMDLLCFKLCAIWMSFSISSKTIKIIYDNLNLIVFNRISLNDLNLIVFNGILNNNIQIA